MASPNAAHYTNDAGECEAATISDQAGNVVCLALNFEEDETKRITLYAGNQHSPATPGHTMTLGDIGSGNVDRRCLTDQQVRALRLWCDGVLAVSSSNTVDAA